MSQHDVPSPQIQCEKFVKDFVLIFEKELQTCEEIASGRKKHSILTRDSEIVGGVDQILNIFMVSLTFFSTIFSLIINFLVEFLQSNSEERAKRILNTFYQIGSVKKRRVELIQLGVRTFRRLESQFMKIAEDKQWRTAFEQLARDAVERSMNYIDKNAEIEYIQENTLDFVAKGMIYGEVRWTTYLMNLTKFNFNGNNTMQKLLEDTGFIYRCEGVDTYYRKKGEENLLPRNGFRYFFNWERDDVDLRASILEECEEVTNIENKYNFVCQNHEEFLNIKIKLLNIIDNQFNAQSNVEKGNRIWFEGLEFMNVFIGRKHQLNQIEMAWWKDNELCVITGLSGVGKSELALQSANHFSDKNFNVFWINAESKETTIESFTRLYEEITETKLPGEDEEEKLVETVRKLVPDVYKNFCDGKSIFVLDNAKDFKSINDFLPPSSLSNKPFVIVTSSRSGWDEKHRKKMAEIILKDMDEKDAVQFFKRTLGIRNNLQDDKIKQFVSKLNYFPLALQQTAAYILKKESHLKNIYPNRVIPVKEYLKEYEEQAERMLEYKGDENEKTSLEVLQIVIEKIKDEQNYGDKLTQILNVSSYFAPDRIPTLAFEKLTENEEELGEIIGLLKQVSIFRQLRREDKLKMHELVQIIVRKDIKMKDLEEEILDKALELLDEKLLIKNEKKEIIIDYVPHIITVWDRAEKYEKLIQKYIIETCVQNKNDNVNRTTFFHLILERSPYELIANIVRYIKEKDVELVELSYNDDDVIRVDRLRLILNTNDQDGARAIHYAALNEDERVVQLLIDNGAKFYKKKRFNLTPLHLAAKRGHKSVCEVLLQGQTEEIKVLNLNLTTKHKFTPLLFAVQNQHLELAQWFLEEGADPNVKTRQEFTCLHFACFNNDLEMVKLLTKNNIDAEVKNNRKETALDLAQGKGYEEIVKMLSKEV